MRFHCNTTCDETIAYLRDQAIRAKQPPAVIDALDELANNLNLPAELEKAEQEASALQNDKDDLLEEMRCLLASLPDLEQGAVVVKLEADELRKVAQAAISAMERNGAGSGDLRDLRRQFNLKA